MKHKVYTIHRTTCLLWYFDRATQTWNMMLAAERYFLGDLGNQFIFAIFFPFVLQIHIWMCIN